MARTKTDFKAREARKAELRKTCPCPYRRILWNGTGPPQAQCILCDAIKPPTPETKLMFGTNSFRVADNGALYMAVDRLGCTEHVHVPLEALRGEYMEVQTRLDDIKDAHIAKDCCKREEVFALVVSRESYSEGKRTRLIGEGICGHCLKPVRFDRLPFEREFHFKNSDGHFVFSASLPELKRVQDSIDAENAARAAADAAADPEIVAVTYEQTLTVTYAAPVATSSAAPVAAPVASADAKGKAPAGPSDYDDESVIVIGTDSDSD